MIDVNVLQWIEDRAAGVKTMDFPPGHLVLKPKGFEVELPPVEPTCTTLALATLESLATYAAENRDSLDLDRCIVTVAGVNQVVLLGPLFGRHRQREILAAVQAGHPSLTLPCGDWYPVETAIEELLSGFAETEHRAELIAIFSDVRATSDVRQIDDGQHQQVTVSEGQVTLARKNVPSPAVLAPMLTFPGEIDPVEHPYIVRLRADGGVSVKLMEADGGAWRLEQKRAVALHLESILPDSLPVLV